MNRLNVFVPIPNNFSMLNLKEGGKVAPTLRLNTSWVVEQNKDCQVKITEMENKYMALQKAIQELDLRVDQVEQTIQDFRESYGNQDAKRELDITTSLVKILETCKKDIN